MKKILSCFLLILVLTACEKEPADALAQVREESGAAVCAAAYLGTYEGDAAGAAAFLEGSEMAEAYPFLTALPFVSTGGESLFCVVPKDADDRVTVSRMEDFEVVETVYESETGEPFLLQCLEVGRRPNNEITFEQAEPVHLTIDDQNFFETDGKVLNFGPALVHDFTIYRPQKTNRVDMSDLVGRELRGYGGLEDTYTVVFGIYGTVTMTHGTDGEAETQTYTGTWSYCEENNTSEELMLDIQLRESGGSTEIMETLRLDATGFYGDVLLRRMEEGKASSGIVFSDIHDPPRQGEDMAWHTGSWTSVFTTADGITYDLTLEMNRDGSVTYTYDAEGGRSGQLTGTWETVVNTGVGCIVYSKNTVLFHLEPGRVYYHGLFAKSRYTEGALVMYQSGMDELVPLDYESFVEWIPVE